LRGYSLIEVMVAIVIIGVMATAGYPKMVETIHQIRLEQNAYAIFEDFCLVRDTAIAAGRSNPDFSQISFYHFNNDANRPITSYSMLDYSGVSVKTVFMRFCNEFDVAVSTPLSIISSNSVCIAPVTEWGASATAPLSRFIKFDRNGIAYRRPNPGAPSTLAAPSFNQPLFYIKSLNLTAMMPQEDVGTWAIQIQSDTSRPVLLRIP